MSVSPLLGGEDEVPAAVLRPAGLVFVSTDRLLFAHAHDADPPFADTETDQVVANGSCTSLTKGEVVLVRTARVGVAFDRDPGRRPPIQVGGVPTQGRPGAELDPRRCGGRRGIEGADGGVQEVPAVILAHGAGNDMSTPLLVAVHEGLASAGLLTVRFNFPYKEKGGRAPDRTPVLEACFRSVVNQIRTEYRPSRVFIGGKSLGGRMASHLAASRLAVDGLVFLGYPLHPPGKLARLRTAHLSRITAPMLFFAGTRDPLCNLDLLRSSLAPLADRATLHVIQDADHSFNVLKRTGRSDEAVREEIIKISLAWVQSIVH